MAEIDCLDSSFEWIDLDFVERERTPQFAIQVGIQLHIAGLSLSNTKQYLDTLGVERSRTAIHNWVQKADLQPDSTASPDQIAVDETVIQVNDQRRWLFAAVDPQTNEFLHVRLFQTRNAGTTMLFLDELRDKQQVDDAEFLVDNAGSLKAALDRLGLRFRVEKHGNRNSIERVFREVKRRTSSFSNTFSNAAMATAESWLQTFAVWWNRCQS
ncbi:IS6 family transposase [Halolamina salifodinae]|uniref:Transposase-like protein n=1 Tax=Halolamina salifodinae TaxID=1202767 RepID=A0A8T4GUE9_9EURY|nr:IS6 family transposase [Halolamina salifodinae]MBP1986020.1 transposase-like protein [Halolamina salifodinae]